MYILRVNKKNQELGTKSCTLGFPCAHTRYKQPLGLQSKRGVTLVELVVGLMLAVIVIGAAGSLIIFGGNLFNHTAQRSQQQVDVTNVASEIAEELRLAQSVEIVYADALPSRESLASNQRILYIGDENGQLASNGYYYVWHVNQDEQPRNYYGTAFYGQYTVSLAYTSTVKKVESDTLKAFDVTVLAHDGNTGSALNMSSTKSFKFVNITTAESPFYNQKVDSTADSFFLLYTYWTEG